MKINATAAAARQCVANALVVIDPKTFNLEEGFADLMKVATAMAVVALFNYLQMHPLPAWNPDRDIDRRQSIPPAA